MSGTEQPARFDHRSARTTAMLQDALISLIRKKRYEAITIKDICDAANVGRSTFYAHSLHEQLLDRQRDRSFWLSSDGDDTGSKFTVLVEQIELQTR
jgi:hypothetical protein